MNTYLSTILIASCIFFNACSSENPMSNDAITKASLEEQWENISADLKHEYNQQDVTTIKSVDGIPQIVGGMMAIAKKIKYSEEAIANNIEGRVEVEFIVNEQGDVIDASIIRGIGYGCDESALLAVTSTKFVAPIIDGSPNMVKMRIPIVFKLQK
jgi:TonB family protein